ncbi:MAG: DUF5805 domain-containing protein [Halorientalis sp.]
MAEDNVQVYTYVPRHQKEAWVDHADRLDMSQSEFVRTMVQAGRRGFEPLADDTDHEPVKSAGNVAENPATYSSNGPELAGSQSGRLEARVCDVLSTGEHLSWDELVAALTDDIEDRLEEALQELQAAGEVRHSGRHGGYALVDE